MVNVKQALVELLAASRRSAPDELPGLAQQAARLLDADNMIIHLVDYNQVNLVPLTAPGCPSVGFTAVEGTLAGRAFTLNRDPGDGVQAGPPVCGFRCWTGRCVWGSLRC